MGIGLSGSPGSFDMTAAKPEKHDRKRDQRDVLRST